MSDRQPATISIINYDMCIVAIFLSKNACQCLQTIIQQYIERLNFLGKDDLLTCKNQQKKPTRAGCKIIDNISLSPMKQFNLFPKDKPISKLNLLCSAKNV